jgi:hypothetical protein
MIFDEAARISAARLSSDTNTVEVLRGVHDSRDPVDVGLRPSAYLSSPASFHQATG